MTPVERRIAGELSCCRFLPASWDKRFCRQMGETASNKPEHPLSDRQRAHHLRLAFKYRRQLSTKIIAVALDEMERAAFNRVEIGLPALPDFTARRQICNPTAPETPVAPEPMPLFEWARLRV